MKWYKKIFKFITSDDVIFEIFIGICIIIITALGFLVYCILK